MTAAPTFDPAPARAAWTTSPEAATPPAVLVLPTGAVEQHGPHLPLGVDAWSAHAVALGAAARSGRACALETSLMLHLWPASVRQAAIPTEPTPATWPDPHLWAPRQVAQWRPFEEIDRRGVIGARSHASAELGARAFDAAVERCAAVIDRLPTTPAIP